jgi:hypothetical protein
VIIAEVFVRLRSDEPGAPVIEHGLDPSLAYEAVVSEAANPMPHPRADPLLWSEGRRLREALRKASAQ